MRGKTTSERFGKVKVVQESRTSTYLENSEIGSSFLEGDDKLNESISDAMQTRDHSHRSCPALNNCIDMWCRNIQPDQTKIFQIQAMKSGQSAAQIMQIDDQSTDIEEIKEQLLSNVDAVKKSYRQTPHASGKETSAGGTANPLTLT